MLDPEVVRRLRDYMELAGSAAPVFHDIRDLLADWERRGEALRWIAEEYADMGAGMTARASLEEGKP